MAPAKIRGHPHPRIARILVWICLKGHFGAEMKIRGGHGLDADFQTIPGTHASGLGLTHFQNPALIRGRHGLPTLRQIGVL